MPPGEFVRELCGRRQLGTVQCFGKKMATVRFASSREYDTEHIAGLCATFAGKMRRDRRPSQARFLPVAAGFLRALYASD